MIRRMMMVALAAGALHALAAAGGSAQSLADRVRSAPDGQVRFSFPTRPGICGDGDAIVEERDGGRRRSRHVVGGSYTVTNADDEWGTCTEGPARIALQVRDGGVTGLRARVGTDWPGGSGRATDLGEVAPEEAVRFLMTLARGGNAAVADKAIFPATIARGVVVWPELLRIARDESVGSKARSQAVFWVGQAAAEAATRGLAELVDDRAADRDVREHAVFALSQRPREEGVPALIQIARSNRDPNLRRKALFWLGQSRDPRALQLFEEILLKS